MPNFMKIYPVGAELFHADWHDVYRSFVSMLDNETLIVTDKRVYHFLSFDMW